MLCMWVQCLWSQLHLLTVWQQGLWRQQGQDSQGCTQLFLCKEHWKYKSPQASFQATPRGVQQGDQGQSLALQAFDSNRWCHYLQYSEGHHLSGPTILTWVVFGVPHSLHSCRWSGMSINLVFVHALTHFPVDSCHWVPQIPTAFDGDPRDPPRRQYPSLR